MMLKSQCTTMHHHAPACATMHHHAPPCTSMHQHAPPCTSMHLRLAQVNNSRGRGTRSEGTVWGGRHTSTTITQLQGAFHPSITTSLHPSTNPFLHYSIPSPNQTFWQLSCPVAWTQFPPKGLVYYNKIQLKVGPFVQKGFSYNLC